MALEFIDLNPQFLKALRLMEEGKKNLFITGKAGTGKSTLLEHFRSKSIRTPVILAPTGAAALNVKGQTMHNFFKFYINVTPEKVKKMRRPKNPQIYKRLKTIIIDEISMARADLLDCADEFLRRFGPKPGLPFGGAQMVFVGDLYQLPPIVSSAEREIFSKHYKTPFFFSAKAFELGFDVEIIELEKIYRQKDQKFISLLSRIRSNSVSDEDLSLLNSRHKPFFEPRADELYVSLTSRNQTADDLNRKRLESLKGRMYRSKALIKGDFGKECFPANPDLRFKIGSQIMLLNNDREGRWVNGSMGAVLSVSKNGEEARIQLHPGNKTVSIFRHRWDVYRFSFSKERQAIVSESAGSFIQFPFRLAWAITIHKSQGKTFERVIIDTSRGMFAGGQAYVALSRCVSFEGIVLKTPFKKDYIKTDRRIFDFLFGGQYREAERQMPAAEKIKMIRWAIKKGNRLKMIYLKPNGIKSRREVKPLEEGKQSYGGKEFQGMRAFCMEAGAERTFRIDRILELSANSETAPQDKQAGLQVKSDGAPSSR